MRLRITVVVAVVVASALLGSVAGAVLGWASGPEHPDLTRGFWLSGGGRLAQDVAGRYMVALERFIVAGMFVGVFLGGAVGVASVLLVGAHNTSTATAVGSFPHIGGEPALRWLAAFGIVLLVAVLGVVWSP